MKWWFGHACPYKDTLRHWSDHRRPVGFHLIGPLETWCHTKVPLWLLRYPRCVGDVYVQRWPGLGHRHNTSQCAINIESELATRLAEDTTGGQINKGSIYIYTYTCTRVVGRWFKYTSYFWKLRCSFSQTTKRFEMQFGMSGVFCIINISF